MGWNTAPAMPYDSAHFGAKLQHEDHEGSDSEEEDDSFAASQDMWQLRVEGQGLGIYIGDM